MKIDPNFSTTKEFMYYAGPYVPSGVIYGNDDWPSRCHWLIPGFDPNSTAINMYEWTKKNERSVGRDVVQADFKL